VRANFADDENGARPDDAHDLPHACGNLDVAQDVAGDDEGEARIRIAHHLRRHFVEGDRQPFARNQSPDDAQAVGAKIEGADVSAQLRKAQGVWFFAHAPGI